MPINQFEIEQIKEIAVELMAKGIPNQGISGIQEALSPKIGVPQSKDKSGPKYGTQQVTINQAVDFPTDWHKDSGVSVKKSTQNESIIEVDFDKFVQYLKTTTLRAGTTTKSNVDLVLQNLGFENLMRIVNQEKLFTDQLQILSILRYAECANDFRQLENQRELNPTRDQVKPRDLLGSDVKTSYQVAEENAELEDPDQVQTSKNAVQAFGPMIEEFGGYKPFNPAAGIARPKSARGLTTIFRAMTSGNLKRDADLSANHPYNVALEEYKAQCAKILTTEPGLLIQLFAQRINSVVLDKWIRIKDQEIGSIVDDPENAEPERELLKNVSDLRDRLVALENEARDLNNNPSLDQAVKDSMNLASLLEELDAAKAKDEREVNKAIANNILQAARQGLPTDLRVDNHGRRQGQQHRNSVVSFAYQISNDLGERFRIEIESANDQRINMVVNSIYASDILNPLKYLSQAAIKHIVRVHFGNIMDETQMNSMLEKITQAQTQPATELKARLQGIIDVCNLVKPRTNVEYQLDRMDAQGLKQESGVYIRYT